MEPDFLRIATFSSSQDFEVWDYSRSHSRLTIATMGLADPPRHSLRFAGVSYLRLPTVFRGIERIIASKGDQHPELRGFLGDGHVFEIRSASGDGVVVAGGLEVVPADPAR